eukprot:TRINITY_DN3833_c0_g2_i2.p1 TRINITY_DN3833_c0_g2~~TRINITY_DN3833_c0_g2_i2.p1  ORF type:complete len:321 (-),score=32.61 TRINITY_DN3833_c0_g2_i2:804-1721(-)
MGLVLIFVSSVLLASVLPSIFADRLIGGVWGDPHFTGGDGSRFNFEGVPRSHYCLVTDVHLHINVYYGGRTAFKQDLPQKHLTWIRKVGILWGPHSLAFSAREGARWQYGSGFMGHMELNGVRITPPRIGNTVTLADGAIRIRLLAGNVVSGEERSDIYEVTIHNILKMSMRVLPEKEALRTDSDAVVHFDLEFPVLQVTNEAHGVLGQTYRRDHSQRLVGQHLEYNKDLQIEQVPGNNAQGFLDGGEPDYRTTGLLNADCHVHRFAFFESANGESSEAIGLASGAIVSRSRTAFRDNLARVRSW